MPAKRLGLSTLIFLGGAVLMLVPALVSGSIYTGRLQSRAEEMLVQSLRTRGELSANLLARRLHQLWQEVDAIARSVPTEAIPEIRRQIDTVSRLDKRYSWIGVAGVDGRVNASTNGMLEGISVAERPWFRRGLEAPTAIDVHEAVLLAKLLPATNEPWRFIDFAAPIVGATGAVEGVVGAHLDWRWVLDNVASLQAPGIDVLLISRDRTVLYGPEDLMGKPLDVGSAISASRGGEALLDERWPDGRDYVTIPVSTVGYADLPSFGWSLLVRQDVQSALQPTRELVRSFWITLGLGAAAALLLLAIGARWIAKPLTRLVASTQAMVSDAEQTALHQESRYREAADLSDGLTRLQSRLMARNLRDMTASASTVERFQRRIK